MNKTAIQVAIGNSDFEKILNCWYLTSGNSSFLEIKVLNYLLSLAYCKIYVYKKFNLKIVKS